MDSYFVGFVEFGSAGGACFFEGPILALGEGAAGCFGGGFRKNLKSVKMNPERVFFDGRTGFTETLSERGALDKMILFILYCLVYEFQENCQQLWECPVNFACIYRK